MSWAARNAAAVFRSTGEAGDLVLRPASSGSVARVYRDVKERRRTVRSLREGGVLESASVRTFSVPRLPAYQAPEEGEFATYDGGTVGTVDTVDKQKGYWTLGVTG